MLRVRGHHFLTLHAFYGQEKLARHRFQNYMGRQRELERLVREVLPSPRHVLIAGDANFASTYKGTRYAGIAGMFLRKCEESRKVIFVDEHRTSVLDSEDFQKMYHPPQRKEISWFGRPYLRRVEGLYQRSAPGNYVYFNLCL